MRITVIGAGSWGTAIAGVAAVRAEHVTLWSHDEESVEGINARHVNPLYLPDYTLPENVSASGSHAEALGGADGIIVVVPSPFLRATIRAAAPHIAPDTPVLTLTKGIEEHTGALMSEVVAEEIGNPGRVAALSGPNHAEEICRGSLSAAVVAAPAPEVAEFFKNLLISPSFRIYHSDDMVGIETCAAVKNVMAIVCGIAAGVGYGDNTLALIMTRGLAEISRLVAARGGNPLTCMGLAGMGDLVATCTSRHSRNRTFGEALARGETLEEFEARTHTVVEGARAAESVLSLAREHGVEVPITSAVHAVLNDGVNVLDATDQLLGRRPSEEFYGIADQEKGRD